MQKTHTIERNRAQCLRCKTVVESTTPYDKATCDCGALTVSGGRSMLQRRRKRGIDMRELAVLRTMDDKLVAATRVFK